MLFFARSALYVRGIVKIGCSVCPFVRSSGFFWFFCHDSNFIARSALYVRGIVKIGCSVCSFVRSFVRSSVRPFGIFWFFIEKNIGVIRCRLAVRFWNPGFKTFLQKVVEVLLSKQNEKYCDRFLDHFFELFWKKLKLHIFHLSRFALVPCAVYLV